MKSWPPPPRLSSAFYKAHGLGNDYLVFEEGDDWLATPENVRLVCHRHRGVGSDGIVALLAEADAPGSGDADIRVRLRMFNPDGGEFERSGNGLRVLASYLMRTDAVVRTMDVEVGGDRVRMVGHGRSDGVYDVSVEMGRARTGPGAVSMDPGALDADGCLPGPEGVRLPVTAVGVGNPHVVVHCPEESEFTEGRLAVVGPYIAEHPALAYGTNVQLAFHDGGSAVRALIWERGVGRTSASGTSACAVAVAHVAAGMMEPGRVTVRMPGGVLDVTVSAELDVLLRGPVQAVMDGRLDTGMLPAG